MSSVSRERVRLQLSVLAYNLGNLWRRLMLPRRIDRWSLTSLQQRLVKTGGRLVRHARYYWLLLAESHLTRRLFGSMPPADLGAIRAEGLTGERLPETVGQKDVRRARCPQECWRRRADRHNSGQVERITTLDPRGEEFRSERGLSGVACYRSKVAKSEMSVSAGGV